MMRIGITLVCLVLAISCDKKEEVFSQGLGVIIDGSSQGFDFKLTYPDGRRRDLQNEVLYGVIVAINGSVTNEFGESARIEGVFWKRDSQ